MSAHPRVRAVFAGLGFSLLAACAAPQPRHDSDPAAAAAAAVVYTGGDILTMAGPEPQYVEALVVSDGRIVHAGNRANAARVAGRNARTIDLGGKTVLPGFIDGHGHIPDYVLSWGLPDLSPPPVGDTTSIADIQRKLKAHLAEHPVPAGQMLVASNYDDSLLSDKRADLVILDRNPLKVDPAAIKDIRVLETIKDGRAVYTAKP